jgi:hypothetical protein
MRRLCLAAPVISGLALVSTNALAQQPQTFTLSKGLYFDCTVAPISDRSKSFELDLSYFVYRDRPDRPQVNFYDPTNLLQEPTGWAPKGHFVLSRLTSDGRLFVWFGQSPAALPTITAVAEVDPVSGDGQKATLTLIHFNDAVDSTVTTETVVGHCQTLSGKEAWDRFQVPRK